MNDQAAGLRELIATMDIAPPQMQARVVAITSGKGGVGKTNISVNLAIYLSRMGRKVALLDADLALANADLIAGVKANANLAHVIAGRKTLDQIMLRGPGGFTLIPAASGLAQMADLDDDARSELLGVMHQVESDHDLILVDTGAGINPTVLSFLLSADETLVVTTAEPTAVTDAYALIKVLYRAKPDAPIALVQNMVSDAKEGRVVFDKINGVCSRFLGHDLLNAGYVPYDKALVAAVRDRTPLAMKNEKSPASRCIERLAMRLDVDTQDTPGSGGFFKKVTRWLRH